MALAEVSDMRITKIREALAKADAGHLEAARYMTDLQDEGWSQRRIADEVGCDQATVSRHVTWYEMDPRPTYGERVKRSSDASDASEDHQQDEPDEDREPDEEPEESEEEHPGLITSPPKLGGDDFVVALAVFNSLTAHPMLTLSQNRKLQRIFGNWLEILKEREQEQ